MPTSSTKPKTNFPTIAAVQARLGNIPEERILSVPGPGTATVQDLLDNSITEGRFCELVDGILVEKPMGFNDAASERGSFTSLPRISTRTISARLPALKA